MNCPHENEPKDCEPCRAATVLWTKHQALAVHAALKMARHYRVGKDSYDDVLQAGFIGLWNAALKFDPSRGFKFSTLAWHEIRGAFTSFYHKNFPFGHAASRAREQGKDVPVMKTSSDLLWIEDRPEERTDGGGIEPYLKYVHGDRNKYILRELYSGNRTARSVAKDLGVTPWCVGLVRKRCLEILREKLGRDSDD